MVGRRDLNNCSKWRPVPRSGDTNPFVRQQPAGKYLALGQQGYSGELEHTAIGSHSPEQFEAFRDG